MNRTGFWRRCLCGLLVLVLALPLLTGCFGDAGNGESTGGSTGGSAADSGTEAPRDPSVPGPDDVSSISLRDMSRMQVVYPAGEEQLVLDELDVLLTQIQRTYGVKLTPVPDTAEVCEDGEILVGNTNRASVSEYIGSLRYYEYGVVIRGNNLVIAGGCPEALCNALIYMRENIVNARKGGSSTFFKWSFNYEARSELYLDSLTLNGRPIQEYVVVYPAGDRQMEMLANRIAFWVRDMVDCELTVRADSSAGSLCEIRIGSASGGGSYSASPREWEGVITASGSVVTLTGGSAAGIAQATESFVQDIVALCEEQRGISGAHDGALTYAAEQIASPGDTLTTMSFNILGSYIEERADRVLQTFLYGLPDVFGVQEGNQTWIDILEDGLDGLYAMSALGNGQLEHPELCPPGAGQITSDAYNMIFYNQAKYELVEEGRKWLSDTPDVCSKYPNSNWPRVVNWVVLRRKADGKIFCFANTHLDEAGDRDKQGTALARLVNEVSARYNNCPTFITGDFNQERTQDGYLNTVAGGYTDSGKVAAIQVNPEKTLFTPFFGEYSPNATHKNNAITVDYCFAKNVPEEDILYYRVIIDRVLGNFPSDHYPVYFRYRLA